MSVNFDPSALVWVAGHRGLVGSALVRRLHAEGFRRLLVTPSVTLDLRNQAAVRRWVADARPEFVFLAAGTVGGIGPNSRRPADFLYDNLMIAANVMEACAAAGVRKLLNLGSSCIYPRDCAQPIREEALLTGPLEPTNEAYAIAKIAGLRLAAAYRRQHGCDFISAMPTNLYGPGDNFDPDDAHVLPALMGRFADAEPGSAVTVWGSGRPRREFLFVDDLADALLLIMRRWSSPDPINVGTGEDLTVAELAAKVRDLVAPGVAIEFDSRRPDGTPQKRLDISKLRALGWAPRTSLDDGLRATWSWFQAHRTEARGAAR